MDQAAENTETKPEEKASPKTRKGKRLRSYFISIAILALVLYLLYPVYSCIRQDMSDDLILRGVPHLLESDFDEEIIKSNVPALVFVYTFRFTQATQATVPGIEAVAEKYQGKIKVVAIRSTVNRQLEKRLNYKNEPCTILYKNGIEISRFVGAMSEEGLSRMIEDGFQREVQPYSAQKDNNTPAAEVITLVESDFDDQVIASKVPVLLSICVDYEDICKLHTPILDDVSREYAGRIKVMKMDRELNELLVEKLRASSPVMILYKDGKIVDQKYGAVSKAYIVKTIQNKLGIK